ncbi:hypothetical protein RB653_002045 [Dictyostelium firmibasis]|uniref:Uncharacterized protein n=1 Tax=Dictyostelium firmibasis TaxID=79012 RepID=A0AAN7TVR7_9MYCE
MEHGNAFCGLKNCVPILKGVALVSGAMFAGISIYIQRVEHPARSTLPTEFAISEWRESFKKAAPLQATLAAISGLSSLLTFGSIARASCKTINRAIIKATEDSVRHCCHCNGLGWLLSGGLMISIIPFTLLALKPINAKLQSKELDTFSNDTRQLLAQWGELHAVRSVLSLTAVTIMGWKIFNHTHSHLLIKS